MAVTFNGDDGIAITGGDWTIDDSDMTAVAKFGSTMNDSSNYTFQSSGNGTTVPIYRTFTTPKNMTVSTSGNTWTHSLTGMYMCHFQFRQSTSADLWNFMSITKNGTKNIVGVSARMGSECCHRHSFHIMYRVDSTTANYRLQGWATGSLNLSGSGTGSPGWSTTYETWQTGTSAGKSLDVTIYRIGAL